MTITTLRELATTDRISDRAYKILRGWQAEIRQADLDELRPSRDRTTDTGLGALRLTLREKLRYLAAVACWDAPLESVPEIVSGLVGHGDLDPLTCWQILDGADCTFGGTDDAVTGTFPWLDRREVPVRRLRMVVAARLNGDRRSNRELSTDPACGAVEHGIVARLSNVVDTTGADLQAHAAAAVRFVADGTTGGYRRFAADRGIRAVVARQLLADARTIVDDVMAPA